MSWRLAKALDHLRSQVNDACPTRSKTDDGTIGDEAHSARTSDHNPDEDGVVKAMDITHDPLHGFDSYKFADALKESEDPRIKYVISNRRIWNPSVSPDWRRYDGANPHNRHVHISVKRDEEHFDDTKDWAAVKTIGGQTIDVNATPVRPLLKIGSTDKVNVELLWILLHADETDGFGPILEAAVKAYQKKHGLEVDGKVGSYTWGKLLKESNT